MATETQSKLENLARKPCEHCTDGDEPGMWGMEYCHQCKGTMRLVPEISEACRCTPTLIGQSYNHNDKCYCHGTGRTLKSGPALLYGIVEAAHRYGYQVTLWLNGDVTLWNTKKQIDRKAEGDRLIAATEALLAAVGEDVAP